MSHRARNVTIQNVTKFSSLNLSLSLEITLSLSRERSLSHYYKFQIRITTMQILASHLLE